VHFLVSDARRSIRHGNGQEGTSEVIGSTAKAGTMSGTWGTAIFRTRLSDSTFASHHYWPVPIAPAYSETTVKRLALNHGPHSSDDLYYGGDHSHHYMGADVLSREAGQAEAVRSASCTGQIGGTPQDSPNWDHRTAGRSGYPPIRRRPSARMARAVTSELLENRLGRGGGRQGEATQFRSHGRIVRISELDHEILEPNAHGSAVHPVHGHMKLFYF
jgi:hypothetical protein